MIADFDNRWKNRIRICLVFAALLALVPAIGALAASRQPPHVEKGVIDLREWNFREMGSVPLDGQWAFYWQQFIPPEGFPEKVSTPPPDYLSVPFVWNGHPHAGRRLPGAGYATYRVRLRLSPEPQPLALHMSDAATACEIYANGHPLYQAGSAGVSRTTSTPGFRPEVIPLPVDSGNLDLVFYVSNYHHRQGGLWARITVGDPAQLVAARESSIAFNMILFGCLLLAGLYHLGLFALRRQDPSPLYFGIGCLSFSLRTFTTGERYLFQLFPGFSFELASKLEYLGYYLAVGAFALFGQSLFPRETDRSTVKFIASAAAGFSVIVLLTPLRFYSYTMPAYQVVTLMVLLYGLFVMGRACINRRPGSGIFLASFFILSATAVNDILYSRQFIHTFYMAQFGLIAFILAQTFLLASRWSKSFETVEVQQTQLRRNEEKYRQLVEHASDGIFILQDNAFRFINPRVEAITGFDQAELMPLSFTALVHPDDRIGVREHLKKGARIMSGITTCSFRLDRPAGETVWVELNTVPTSWESQPATLNFLRDISRQKRLESQLSQAQKMEALGTLSGGIALNFNNILGSIVGNAELAIAKLPAGDPQRPHLHQVIDACMKARLLVEQIQLFSQRGQTIQSPVDIAAVVDGAVQFLSASISPEIRVHAHIDTRGITVMANANQISQLLLNLATNAAQAMPERGGDLHISLHPMTIRDGQKAGEVELAPGEYVRLTVADNGSGIPAAIQSQVFDPYFTTKAREGGTGMGLSVVMGIVNSHGGHIDLISTPGLGTTFHIYLPVMKNVGRTEPDTHTPVGWERILVVDDDERILKVLVEMLEHLGYAVSPFKNAEAALEFLHRGDRPFDLVITDLAMPGMAGVEFARRVKDLRGDLPILLCTGFLESPETEHADIITAVLKKPFYKEELARVVRKALDEKMSTHP